VVSVILPVVETRTMFGLTTSTVGRSSCDAGGASRTSQVWPASSVVNRAMVVVSAVHTTSPSVPAKVGSPNTQSPSWVHHDV
jgi:hypothetical protein